MGQCLVRDLVAEAYGSGLAIGEGSMGCSADTRNLLEVSGERCCGRALLALRLIRRQTEAYWSMPWKVGATG